MTRWWGRWDEEMGNTPPCPVTQPGLYELWNGMKVAIHRVGASAVQGEVPTRSGRRRTVYWRTADGRLLTATLPPHYNIRRRLPWANADGTINYPTERWEEVFDDKGRIRVRDIPDPERPQRLRLPTARKRAGGRRK